jgi:hypothetical protein
MTILGGPTAEFVQFRAHCRQAMKSLAKSRFRTRGRRFKSCQPDHVMSQDIGNPEATHPPGACADRRCRPDADIAQFTRVVIERFLGLLIEEGLVANGRSMVVSTVKTFFHLVRQHDWLPGSTRGSASTPRTSRDARRFHRGHCPSSSWRSSRTQPTWPRFLRNAAGCCSRR